MIKHMLKYVLDFYLVIGDHVIRPGLDGLMFAGVNKE
jgi:hypothetical protein